MEGGLGKEWLWYPLGPLGITHPATAVQADILISTWVTLAVLCILIVAARYALTRKESLGAFFVKSIIKSFMQLIVESTGTFIYRYYALIASFFIFIILCNWIALIPYVGEPTKDINTTLAFGIIAFLFIQKEIIKVHGLLHYLKDYFAPVAIMFPFNILVGLAILPIKLLGELASVISLSFRLFGNIFGGTIIIHIFQSTLSNSVLYNTIGTLSGISLLLTGFFIIFEGFLQAFVFSILTLTNISMAVAVEQQENEK